MVNASNGVGQGTSARNGDIGTSGELVKGELAAGMRASTGEARRTAPRRPVTGPVFGGGQTGSAWGLIRAWTIFPSSTGA
jgi:hypothetical protein